MHIADNDNDRVVPAIRPYTRPVLNGSRGDPATPVRGFIVRQLVDSPTRVFRGRRILLGDSRSDVRDVVDQAADLTALGEHVGEIVTAARYAHPRRRLLDTLDQVRVRLTDIGANALVERPDEDVMRDLSTLLYHAGDLCNPDPRDDDELIGHPPRG